MLKKLLSDANAIQLQVEESDWKKALEIAAVPLVKNGTISSGYLNAIIAGTEELGVSFPL